MWKYIPEVNEDLDRMTDDLEMIANLTQGTEEKIVYMKDSAVEAQKSSQPGNTLPSSLQSEK